MDDDNWLEAEVLVCPSCGVKLYAVVHSPFFDEDWLYCNRCPKLAVVGRYDPVYRDNPKLFPPTQTPEQKASTIECLLRACDCGGRFEYGAARHCFACGVQVPAADWKDLSPYTGCEDGTRQYTNDDQIAYDRFVAEFHRRENLWRPVDEIEP